MQPGKGQRVALVVCLLLAGPARAGPPPCRGALLFAGGNLRFGNAAVWERFVELAGGKGARVAVIPAAAFDPRKSGQAAVDNLRRYGADAELLPIAPHWRGVDFRLAVRDPANVARLRKAQGVWFIGGDQRRITRALVEPDGSQTPALAAIWRAYQGGAVVGGTSAGAAVMSRHMFANAMNSLDTLKFGITRGVQVDAGLGFVGGDWFVDQHFLVHGRFARALVAMRDYHYRLGIGVDEDTAAVLEGGSFEVVGHGGVLVLDLAPARFDPRQKEFNVRMARLSYLEAGDRIDARTGKVVVHRFKRGDRRVDPGAGDFDPAYYRPEDFYFPDMLGSGAIYRAMRNALDSRRGVVRGLAFAQPEGGKRNDLGFDFTVYRSKETAGWYTGRGGHEAYTILGVYVDVVPVRLARPLFTPLKP